MASTFLAEYAYVMKPKGRLYAITDVEDLHNWHTEHLEGHSMWRRLGEKELENDICVKLIWGETEEGKKVERNKGSKFVNVFERLED